MTIRYSAAANDAAPLEYRPGGRWERVLRSMVRHGRPMTRADLLPDAMNPDGKYSRQTERQKLARALRAMAFTGLVHCTPRGAMPSLWIPTASGERAVTDWRIAA